MRLLDYLQEWLKQGIPYEDATDLCKAIYCRSDILPAVVEQSDLSMEPIASAFSALCKRGLISGYSPQKAIVSGANYHEITEKGHWIEVQASILKLAATYNTERIDQLLVIRPTFESGPAG